MERMRERSEPDTCPPPKMVLALHDLDASRFHLGMVLLMRAEISKEESKQLISIEQQSRIAGANFALYGSLPDATHQETAGLVVDVLRVIQCRAKILGRATKQHFAAVYARNETGLFVPLHDIRKL